MAKNKKHIIAKRRSQVADLYLRGFLQHDIATRLKISQSQVSRDLKELSKQWQQSALIDIDEIKGRELARLNLAEVNLWKSWKRSCQVRIKKRHSESTGKDGQKIENSTEKSQMVGDPRIMQEILRCIQMRCRILGLESAQKFDIDLNRLTNEQLDQIIEEIVNRNK